MSRIVAVRLSDEQYRHITERDIASDYIRDLIDADIVRSRKRFSVIDFPKEGDSSGEDIRLRSAQSEQSEC